MSATPSKYPPPQPGDVFGNVRVLEVFRGRTPGGFYQVRSDLRARVECMTCGQQGDTYVFNLRNSPPKCVKRSGCNLR